MAAVGSHPRNTMRTVATFQSHFVRVEDRCLDLSAARSFRFVSSSSKRKLWIFRRRSGISNEGHARALIQRGKILLEPEHTGVSQLTSLPYSDASLHVAILERPLHSLVGLLAGRKMRGRRLSRPLRPAVGAWVGARLHDSVAGYVGFGIKTAVASSGSFTHLSTHPARMTNCNPLGHTRAHRGTPGYVETRGSTATQRAEH